MTDSMHYSPRSDWRRQPDRPSLWVLLVAGSVLIHLLTVLVVRQWFMRSGRVELSSAPISVEFVEPARSAARPVAGVNRSARSTVNQTVSAPSSGQPVSSDRSTVIDNSTPPIPSTESERSLPSRPPASPSPVTPQRLPRRELSPERTQNPPATEPLPQNNSSDLPTTEVARGAVSPRNDDSVASSGQPAQVPVRSGNILPGLQEGKAVVELLDQHQVQDFKQQQARARELNRQLSIYYPSKPAQPIEIEAHLDIGTQGEMLGVLDVKVLNSGGATVEPKILEELAEQVFRNWRFTPAQDGTPPKPVRSDLIVQARITVL